MNEKYTFETCRLCSREACYDMFEHKLEISEDNLVLISDAYQVFSSVKIDNLSISSMLCVYCTEELGQAYNFYVKVKLSDVTLSNTIEDDDEEIDPNYIEIIDDQQLDQPLTNDEEDPNIKLIAAIENDDDNDESQDTIGKDVDICNDDDAEIEIEKDPIEIVESVSDREVFEVNTKKPNKIPNIQLTSKVSTLLNRITKSTSILQKRKFSTTVDADSDSSSKIMKFEDSFILAPKFVLHETKYIDQTVDRINDDPNRIAEFSEIGSVGIGDSELKQNLNSNKRKMPALPTHKVTMDIAAVKVGTNSTQLDIYSNLDKKEDASVLYQCSYCPKAFATQYHLGLHTQKGHICQHCLAGFNKIQDLYAHVKSEHNTFTCTFCNKQMSTNSNLRAHVRKIHGVTLPAGVSLISLQKQ